MSRTPDIQLKRRQRMILVSLVLVALAGGVGGLYGIKAQRTGAHVDGLKPQGLKHVEAGEYQQAMNLLASYLGRHPNDVDALRGYATARSRVFDAGGAHVRETMSLLRRVVLLAPEDEASQRELLDLYVESRFSTEAVELANILLDRHTDDYQALRAKARALGQKRSWDEAFEVADHYNTLRPDDIELQILTLAIMQARDLRSEDIIVRARELALAHRGDGRFTMVVGVAYQIAGDLVSARLAYQAAAEDLPHEAEEIGRLAELMDQVGLFGEATALLQRAERAIDDPVLMRLLLRRLWEQGRNDLVLQRAESLDPRDNRADTEAMAVLAVALIQTGERERASAYIRQLEQRRRDNLAQAWAGVLNVLADEQVASARLANVVSTALLRHPDHPYFHYLHGVGLAGQGEREQAIEAWQRAGRAAPSWAAPLLRVARVFVETDRAYLAIDVARAAVQRAPNNVEAAIVFLEAHAANLDQVDDQAVIQLGSVVHQVVSEVPETRRRMLPLMVALHARRGDTDDAVDLIRDALSAEAALPATVLLQLADVSRRYGLGLYDDCLLAAEAAHGATPQLAHARALREIERQGATQAIARFDEIARSADAGDADLQRAWKLYRVSLLAVADRRTALEYWRHLIETHESDVRLHEAAARSDMVWSDIALARQVVRQLGVLTQENGTSWRVARARLLMHGQGVTQRSLADASLLLLEVTRQMPYLIEPRLMLAQCFEKMDQPRRALEFLEQAHRLAPHASSIALERARLLQAVGETADAAELLQSIGDGSAFTPSQKLQLATLHGQRGEFAPAERLLKAILVDAPEHRGARQLLAFVYQARGLSEEAEALYKVLLEEPDAWTLQAASGFYEAQGKIDLARELLNELDLVEMDDGDRALMRSAFLRRQRQPEEALATLVQAVARGPVSRDVWQQIIVLQLQAGQTDEALSWAAKAASAHPDEAGFITLVRHRQMVDAVAEQPRLRSLAMHIVADETHREVATQTLRVIVEADRNRRQMRDVAVELTRLAERSPRFLTLQNLLVSIHQSMGRFGDAADVAVRTMRTMPDSPQAAWMAVEALAAADRWDEALRLAQQLREQSRDGSLGADLVIAEAQLRLGRGGAAADQLHEHLASGTEPEMVLLIHRTQARGLISDDRADEARQLLQPMLTNSLEHRRLYLQLAVTTVTDVEAASQWLADLAEVADTPEEHLALAQGWRAVDERFGIDRYTSRAIERLSSIKDLEGVAAQANQTLGMIHEAQGDMEEAEDHYRQALRYDAELPVALNNLAMVLLNRDERSESLQFAQRAVALQQNVPAFLDTLALSLIANDQPAMAIKAAEHAVRLEPRKVEWYVTLGEALVQAGDGERTRGLVEWLDESIPTQARFSEPVQTRLESLRRAVHPPAGVHVDPASPEAGALR
jgi:tetratricopeptide (TPR) repeat protein